MHNQFEKGAFMKKFALLLGSCLIMSISAEAALPPVYESVKELRTLLDSPQLTDQLGSGEAIQSITRDDKGFIVKSTKYTLKVDVIYDPVNHPGPAKFHLKFHNVEKSD